MQGWSSSEHQTCWSGGHFTMLSRWLWIIGLFAQYRRWFTQFYGCFAHVRESYFARIICFPCWQWFFHLVRTLVLVRYQVQFLTSCTCINREFHLSSSMLPKQCPITYSNSRHLNYFLLSLWSTYQLVNSQRCCQSDRLCMKCQFT